MQVQRHAGLDDFTADEGANVVVKAAQHLRAASRLPEEADYRGWLVVEAEQDPAVAPSYIYAKKGYDTLRALLNQRT